MPCLLARLLSSLPRLSDLTLLLPEEGAHLFSIAFHSTHLSLPSVRVLALRPGYDFMIGLCPNVSAIHGKRFCRVQRPVEKVRSLTAAAASARKLEHFEVETWWQEYMAEGM